MRAARSRRWEPQPGQWHRAAMTERASPSPESRHAAISCLFGRAMLSLRLLFSVSILALSGAPRQLSQRESLGQRGQALRDAKASPFGRGGIAQAMTERASPSPESRHAAISPSPRAMLSGASSCLFSSDAIAAPIPLRRRPCPLRRSAPALPKGEPKGILPDVFSPFTQERG